MKNNKLISSVTDDYCRKVADEYIESLTDQYKRDHRIEDASFTVYASMVAAFANQLPYSIDILQEEYVPADFLNIVPTDADNSFNFKFDDWRTIFIRATNWGDTYRSGMILQMCCVFQKMILGEFPYYNLTEDDYTKLNIDIMTENEEYNRNFFEVLKSLPDYYSRVVSAKSNEERRGALEQFYQEAVIRLANRFDSFRYTRNGKVIIDNPGCIPIYPRNDVQLLFYRKGTYYSEGITEIIKVIKEAQLEKYGKELNKAKAPQLPPKKK